MIKKRFLMGFALVLVLAGQAAGEEVVDRIVAIVNNEIITQVQLEKKTALYQEKIEASDSTQKRKEELLSTMKTNMLHQLIDKILVNQEADRYHVEVTDAEVNTAVENFMAQHGLDQDSLEGALASENLTFEEYKENVRQEIIQSRLINRAVRSKVIITDSDIAAYYAQHADDFKGVEKYELRNIIMKDADQIQQVKEQLEHNASFKDLAGEYSIGSNASDGGYLGTFEIDGLSENIKQALQGVKKGGHTDIIDTPQGFQILYVQDIIMSGGKTLEQASEEIQQILYNQLGKEKFAQWIESLKEHAHVKIML